MMIHRPDFFFVKQGLWLSKSLKIVKGHTNHNSGVIREIFGPHSLAASWGFEAFHWSTSELASDWWGGMRETLLFIPWQKCQNIWIPLPGAHLRPTNTFTLKRRPAPVQCPTVQWEYIALFQICIIPKYWSLHEYTFTLYTFNSLH